MKKVKSPAPVSEVKNFISIFLFSTGILIFLFWWVYGKETSSVYPNWVLVLPYLNCTFNLITATLLIYGLKAIKKGNVETHKFLMFLAVIFSGLFLISYLLYHHFHGDTKFIGIGYIRYIYFSLLISHILLSIIQIPLILSTLFFAYKRKWYWHKKMAKITFPIWLYVSITGVIIFAFLKLINH